MARTRIHPGEILADELTSHKPKAIAYDPECLSWRKTSNVTHLHKRPQILFTLESAPGGR